MIRPKIISRDKAIKNNLVRYFTAKPCVKGHVAERSTLSGKCYECEKFYYQANKEKIKETRKIYRQKNKKKIAVQNKKYKEKNKIKLEELGKEYRKKNKVKIADRSRKFYEKNKDKIKSQYYENFEEIKELRKKYYQENSDKIKHRRKESYPKRKQKILSYQEENREKILILRRKNFKKKYENDPSFKNTKLLYSRMRKLVNKGQMKKPNQSTTEFAREVIGLSQQELIAYLEKKFYPHPKTGKKMTWKNHSLHGWHIDHIKPVTSFNLSKLEEQKKCFHYSNLQPMWAEENLKKSNN